MWGLIEHLLGNEDVCDFIGKYIRVNVFIKIGILDSYEHHTWRWLDCGRSGHIIVLMY